MSESEKQSPTAEEGGIIGVARDSTTAEKLEQTRSRARMQDRMDALERQAACVDELERKCRAREEENKNWKYSAPAILDGYWLQRGFAHVFGGMKRLVQRMEYEALRMRQGKRAGNIYLGEQDCEGRLLHDEALQPHWKEFADALQLSDFSGDFSISNTQLPSDVLDMLAPALAMKQVRSLTLSGNDFTSASDGVNFATELIEKNPHLQQFDWINNPIDGTKQANAILKVVASHPGLDKICLKNSLGPNVNGYHVLCSLIASKKSFLAIDLESSNILTNGKDHLPEFLATDPPLRSLNLRNNHLNDHDAISIADSLKRNTNLQHISIGENDFTKVGHDALRNAIFDARGLNCMAACNHTCQIDLDSVDFIKNDRPSSRVNRARKLHSLLSLKYRERSIVNDLVEEFGDDALKFAPNVLERVHMYSRCFEPHERLPEKLRPAEPLSILYEIVRGWKMPELCATHMRKMSKKTTIDFEEETEDETEEDTEDETEGALGAASMTHVEAF